MVSLTCGILKNNTNEKVRISVLNTGDNISEENLNRIWNRFYKVDSSRNRADGGSGIGLSLVKAIMMNYNNDYGAINTKNGVEFYFELDQDVRFQPKLQKAFTKRTYSTDKIKARKEVMM